MLTRISQITLEQVSQNNSHERNVFRFLYDRKNSLMYITFVETSYKYWQTSALENSREYFQNHTVSWQPQFSGGAASSSVFLRRNIQKHLTLKDVYIRNQLSYQTAPNSLALLTSSGW